MKPEGEEIDTQDKRYRMSSSDYGLLHMLTVVNQGTRESGKYFCVLRSPLRSTLDKKTQTITPPGEWWEIFDLEHWGGGGGEEREIMEKVSCRSCRQNV